MTNPITRIERHDYRDPLGHPLVNDVDWKAIAQGNKALADRLDAILREPGLNLSIKGMQAFREAATALTATPSAQAQAGEGHDWSGDGEHCAKCGDSDWYAGPVCTGRLTPQPQGDASPHFADAAALADWLESLHETNDDGAVTGNKWEPAQRAAAAIRAPQVSGGGAALTDDEVIERCEAAGLKWLEPDNVLPDGTIDLDGFPGSFDMVTMAEMRALFAALTPRAHEPACPECYSPVLFECVACSATNYPHEPAPQPVNPAPVSSKSTVEPAPTADGGAVASEAYDRIDRYLRNSLMDDDYAEYSEALETVYTRPAPAPDVARLVEKVEAALDEADRRIGRHEATHRGGAIWEICDDCGQRWADDRGGRKPDNWPDILDAAYEALAPFTAAQPKEEG